MRTEECHQMAEELLAAYQTRSPIAPLTDRFPDLTVAEGFDIQRAQVDRWMAEGRIIKGHKVGLTSAAMQRQMGVNQPDFGVLHDQMFHPESDPIPVTAFLQPRVEPEIALVIKRDLAGPGVTVAEALAAVDFVLPALEIIDSRIADWRISVADTVADNASSGGSRARRASCSTHRCGPSAPRMQPVLQRRGGRDGCRGSGARLAGDIAGMAGQHPGSAERLPESR